MADEKKRIIDLSELSQEVQVGQYILVDSASGTGKMNLKKIVDDSTTSLAERVTDLETGLTEEENARIAADTELSGNVSNLQTALETKADNNGYYPDLYAGNLSSTKKQTDSVPYLMRKTAGGAAKIGEREDDTLVGATVNVNQLFNPSRVEYGAFPFTKNGIEFTLSEDGRIILNGTATADTFALGFAKILSGHKYYRKNLKSNPFNIFSYYPLDDESIVNATEDNGYAVITIPNGTTVTNYEYCGMLVDLTAEFGTTIADYLYTLEHTTAGAGIAKLREWGFLTDEYIPYNPGSLESVEATAHKTVGFNQFDADNTLLPLGFTKEADGAYYLQTASSIRPRTIIWENTFGYEGAICLRFDYRYSPVTSSSGARFVINYTDGTSLNTYPTPSSVYTTLTVVSTSGKIVKNITYDFGSGGISSWLKNFCINISNPDRNGEYEPYSSHTYDLGTDTLRGLFKLDSNNNLYADGDTKTSDGTVRRKYGTRAYQSGDESLADAITDGTNTVYKLTTPTTETSTPFQNPQICDPDGTEEYVTSNWVPVGHETEYDYDIKGLAEELIDVPDVPSSNGTYVLKATRTADGLSYSWVAG